MQESCNELYGAVVDAVLKLQKLLAVVVADRPKSLHELTDKLFAMRECIKGLKDITADIKRAEAIQEKLFTAVYLASYTTADKVKTEFVTAEAIPKLGTRVPSRYEEAYGKLMSFLGVPDALIEYCVFEIHFPSWCDYYTSLQARGESVPDEIMKHLTEYELTSVKTIKQKAMRGSIDVQG